MNSWLPLLKTAVETCHRGVILSARTSLNDWKFSLQIYKIGFEWTVYFMCLTYKYVFFTKSYSNKKDYLIFLNLTTRFFVKNVQWNILISKIIYIFNLK